MGHKRALVQLAAAMWDRAMLELPPSFATLQWTKSIVFDIFWNGISIPSFTLLKEGKGAYSKESVILVIRLNPPHYCLYIANFSGRSRFQMVWTKSPSPVLILCPNLLVHQTGFSLLTEIWRRFRISQDIATELCNNLSRLDWGLYAVAFSLCCNNGVA